MEGIDIEQRLVERRVWLVSMLAATAVFAVLFHAFPRINEPEPMRLPHVPIVYLQPCIPVDRAADQAVSIALRSPVLMALPSRALPQRKGSAGESNSDLKPPLEMPEIALLWGQPPRDIGLSLDDWVIRLRRERDLPPIAISKPETKLTAKQSASSWTAFGGLAGLEADLTPVLQFAEQKAISGSFTAWLALDEHGSVKHAMIEPALPDGAAAAGMDRALRNCVFWPVTEAREGHITILLH